MASASLLVTAEASDNASNWSVIWPYLLTAALTLAIALIVQLYIVPRVESRKRRDDRWERDVLALGQLLSIEQPEVSSRFGHELWWLVTLNDPPEDFNPERVEKAKRENADKLREAKADYDRMDVQVDWLIDRIESIGRSSPAIQPFLRARRAYALAEIMLSGASYATLEEPITLTLDKLDELQDKERDAVRKMVAALKDLLRRPPPSTKVSRKLQETARRRIAKIKGRFKRSKH